MVYKKQTKIIMFEMNVCIFKKATRKLVEIGINHNKLNNKLMKSKCARFNNYTVKHILQSRYIIQKLYYI